MKKNALKSEWTGKSRGLAFKSYAWKLEGIKVKRSPTWSRTPRREFG